MKALVVALILLLPALAFGSELSEAVLKESSKYMEVREITSNRSPEIDRMHDYLGIPYGNPWCMLYVQWCYYKGGEAISVPNPLPRSARVSIVWKAAQKNPFKYKVLKAKRMALNIEKGAPADVIVWSSGKVAGNDNWNGHTGLLLSHDKLWLHTREGNTTAGTAGNQRDGGGVYDRWRKLDIGNKFQVEGVIRPREE